MGKLIDKLLIPVWFIKALVYTVKYISRSKQYKKGVKKWAYLALSEGKQMEAEQVHYQISKISMGTKKFSLGDVIGALFELGSDGYVRVENVYSKSSEMEITKFSRTEKVLEFD